MLYLCKSSAYLFASAVELAFGISGATIMLANETHILTKTSEMKTVEKVKKIYCFEFLRTLQ